MHILCVYTHLSLSLSVYIYIYIYICCGQDRQDAGGSRRCRCMLVSEHCKKACMYYVLIMIYSTALHCNTLDYDIL